MAINRHSKKLGLAFEHVVPKINPVQYTKDLIKEVGYDQALRITGEANALASHIAKNLTNTTGFFNMNEFKKTQGHWQTAFGYVKNIKNS